MCSAGYQIVLESVGKFYLKSLCVDEMLVFFFLNRNKEENLNNFFPPKKKKIKLRR